MRPKLRGSGVGDDEIVEFALEGSLHLVAQTAKLVAQLRRECVVCTSAERTDLSGSVSSSPLPNRRTVPRFGGARTRRGDRVLVSLAQNPPGVSSPRPNSPGRGRGWLFVDVACCSAVAAHCGPRLLNHGRRE